MIPKRIVAIGTSAFFGYGDASGKGGYIGRLKEWHEKTDKNNAVFNLGISGKTVGETTAQLLERLKKEVAPRQPDLILLTTGINDVRRHGEKDALCAVSENEFKENVHQLIHNAKEIVPQIVMIGVIPTKDKHDSLDNYLLAEDIARYAAFTKIICQEENIPYIDIYQEWRQEDYQQFLFQDAVHANEKGYEKIFQQVKDFLDNLYKE